MPLSFTSSMSTGVEKVRHAFTKPEPYRASPYTVPSVTPYLSLRARLSQIWINRWTVLLLLVLARTLIAIADINQNLGSARREALSACGQVESLGSAMASMPHYMSQGVNAITADGVEKSVHALMQTTTLAVTGVEEIVVFVINMMTSTYLCLITFAITGSLRAVINTMDSAQDQLNDMTKALGGDMAGVVSDFQTAYNDIKNTLSKATLGLGSGINLPTLDVTDDINKLQNLTLPPALFSDLQKLNDSLPTFEQVQNVTDNAIRIPFEDLKQLINASLTNYTFDKSVFPVPQKEALSFCSDDNGINDFFDHLVSLAASARKIFIAVLVLAAILVCIPMAYREIRRWRTMRERAQLVGSQEHDPLDVVYIVSRPYTASAGMKASNAASSSRRKVLIRWIVAYATTEAALFVLCLALAGLFSVLCQYILLKSLEKSVPDLTNEVGAFADKVVLQLNNASESWALGANNVITDLNTTVNDDLLGWVNTSTTALNNTLNTFVNLTMDVLNTTFGGTPLYDPVLEVLNCLVLLKVKGFEKGLTWVHDNAHINMPLMRNDTFSLGAVASIASDATPDSSFLANPGDQASDKISQAVVRFTTKIEEGIATEAAISAVVLAVYFTVVLIGVVRALMLFFGRDKTRGNGGAAPTVEPPSPVMTQTRSHHNTDFASDDQDRFVSRYGDIPLGGVPYHAHGGVPSHARPESPAPNYASVMAARQDVRTQPVVTVSHEDAASVDDPFADEKGSSSRIRSQHGSIWTADRKQ